MADETYVHVGDQVFKVAAMRNNVENDIIRALKGGEVASFGFAMKVLGSEQNISGRLIIGQAQTIFTADRI